MKDAAYYHARRAEWAPTIPTLIVIAESPPISGKYFYEQDGEPTEALFLALMESLVGQRKQPTKQAGLQAFKDRGFLLLDATYTQVDDMNEGRSRDEILVTDFPKLLGYLAAVNSNRNVPLLLIKRNVCQLLRPKLLDEGFKVLNEAKPFVPFPSHGNQGRFRDVVATILAREGLQPGAQVG